MDDSASDRAPPAVERGWCEVKVVGDYVLVSETGTATVYRWSTRTPIRSIWTDAMYYGCAIAVAGDRPVLVAFGDQGACAWDVASGALLWRRAEHGTSSHVILIPRRGGTYVGATRVEKWGGPRVLLDLATGEDVAAPKRQSRKGKYLASDFDRRRYAIFDGQNVVIRADDDSEVATLSWKAHLDEVEVEHRSDGTVVTSQRFVENAEGLFAFGDDGFLAVNTPDVVRCDRAGRALSSWRMPETERVMDVAGHAGRWYLLMRRWPTPERVGLGVYVVRVLDRDAPARAMLFDCDGIAIVHGHVLTAALELIPVDGAASAGRLAVPPPQAFQLAVNHPRLVDKRLMGWKGEWEDDPTKLRSGERRAGAVREFLDTAPPKGPAPAPRAAGAIAVEPELGRALIALRLLEGGDAKTEVTLAALADAEAALGWPLPDAIVTLLASRAAYLEREWKLQVAALARTHARGRKTVVAGLRPIAFAAGRKRWLCVRGDGADARLYIFNDRARQSVGPFEPVEWVTRELSHVRERVRKRWLDGDSQAKELLLRERALEETAFTPRVI
jgi:hypothetical protein